MDKKQEKKIWNSQLAIENPKNDRIAVTFLGILPFLIYTPIFLDRALDC